MAKVRRRTATVATATEIPGAPYKLAAGLDPADYRIGASLRDRDAWEAYTHDGQGDDRAGTFAKVGYVWIGLDDDAIIPISRGDEHHRGADTLIALKRRGGLAVDLRRYMPVWIHGTNYCYDAKSLPDWVVVLRKLMAWGGPDGKFCGWNDADGVMTTSSILVARNGDVMPRPHEIAPLGLRLIEAMEAGATAILPPAGGTGRGIVPDRAAKTAVRRLIAAYADVEALMPDVVFEKGGIGALRSTLKEAVADDVVALNEICFGYGSLKRRIHERVRRAIERKARGIRTFEDRDFDRFWGDLGAAEARLAAI